MEISSRLKEWPNDKPSVVVNFDLPEDHDGLVSKFGKEVVAANAVDSIVISVQALVRRMLKSKKPEDQTQAAIQAKVDAYVPSATSAVRRTPSEKIEDLAGKLSAEETQSLIKKLREQLASQKQAA